MCGCFYVRKDRCYHNVGNYHSVGGCLEGFTLLFLGSKSILFACSLITERSLLDTPSPSVQRALTPGSQNPRMFKHLVWNGLAFAHNLCASPHRLQIMVDYTPFLIQCKCYPNSVRLLFREQQQEKTSVRVQYRFRHYCCNCIAQETPRVPCWSSRCRRVTDPGSVKGWWLLRVHPHTSLHPSGPVHLKTLQSAFGTVWYVCMYVQFSARD